MSNIKYKNVFGEQDKETITNVNMLEQNTEGQLLATNGVFIAGLWSGLGANVKILDYNFRGYTKVETNSIKVSRQTMDDLEFSPVCSDILSVACADNTVKLYKIPEGGLTEDITTESVSIKKNKKCTFNRFNPVAADISALFFNEPAIDVWSAETGKSIAEMKLKENCTCLNWSPNGVLVGATLKNKTLNVFDPRANKLTICAPVSEANRSPKFTWLTNEEIAVLGYSKNNTKELRLYDLRKVKEDLTFEAPTSVVEIDKSSVMASIFYDSERELLYTAGRGESTIKFFYKEGATFKKGNDCLSDCPATFIANAPRRFVDYEKTEINTFVRFVTKNKSYVFTHFKVPRRNEGFEPELYPDVFTGEPSLTAQQWIAGENAEQIKKPIDTIEKKFIGGKCEATKTTTEEKKVDDGKVKELEGKVAELEKKVKELTEENDKLKKELEETKAKIPAPAEEKPAEE